MKRPHTSHQPIRHLRDIKNDVSRDQLAGIGAITLAYNYAESSINRMLAPALNLSSDLYLHVTTRINGVDGKIELLKLAAKDIGIPTEMRNFLAESLGEGGFGLFKKYRDAIIHARILDPDTGFGEGVEKRGKMYEVLLTADALDRLYDHLDLLSEELACFILIFVNTRVIKWGDKERERLEQEIQDAFSLARQHRTRRLSLPQLPEFPKEAPPEEQENSPRT